MQDSKRDTGVKSSLLDSVGYVHGQKRSLSKMVGGEKLCLESNPIPARDAQRAQTNLLHTRTQTPPQTETELCLSISCGGMGQQWSVAETGALGVGRPKSSWRRLPLTSPQSCQNLHRRRNTHGRHKQNLVP